MKTGEYHGFRTATDMILVSIQKMQWQYVVKMGPKILLIGTHCPILSLSYQLDV